jgi:hypothetical protein
MYGEIGDILRNYGRRGQTDGVNKWAGRVRREIVWLPDHDSNALEGIGTVRCGI